MAAKRRAKRRSSGSQERSHRLSVRAGVWLATLSTVVGVATGMFTLRDEIFPNEAGVATALPGYQERIGRLCDAVNHDESRRVRELKTAIRKVKVARTTAAQRNFLATAQRDTNARSSHTLAQLAGLDAPQRLAAAREQADRAWNRNLGRLRGYVVRLDRATSRRSLLAALRYLSDQSPAIARDGVVLMASLTHLGGADCDLAAPKTAPTFTLPVPLSERPKHTGGDGGGTNGGGGHSSGAAVGGSGSSGGSGAAGGGGSIGGGGGGGGGGAGGGGGEASEGAGTSGGAGTIAPAPTASPGGQAGPATTDAPAGEAPNDR